MYYHLQLYPTCKQTKVVYGMLRKLPGPESKLKLKMKILGNNSVTKFHTISYAVITPDKHNYICHNERKIAGFQLFLIPVHA